MTTLGERLKEAREAKGYTQQYVAGVLGLSSQALSNYERGLRDPDTNLLLNLANLYSVSTDWLLGRAVNKHTPGKPSWLDKVPMDLRAQIEDLVATGDMGAVYLRAGVGMAKDAQLNDYPPEALEPIARAMIDAGHKIRRARARKLKNIGKGNKTID